MVKALSCEMIFAVTVLDTSTGSVEASVVTSFVTVRLVVVSMSLTVAKSVHRSWIQRRVDVAVASGLRLRLNKRFCTFSELKLASLHEALGL